MPDTTQDQQQLVVRRSVRYAVSFKGQMAVAPAHAGLLKFGASCGGRDGWIAVDIVDFGLGGVGISTPVFVPRRARMRLRLLSEADRPGGQPLEMELRVQRVTMSDRRPTYLLGTAFVEPDAALSRRIEAMVAQIVASGAVPCQNT